MRVLIGSESIRAIIEFINVPGKSKQFFSFSVQDTILPDEESY